MKLERTGRLLALLLAVLMVVSLLPVTALAWDSIAISVSSNNTNANGRFLVMLLNGEQELENAENVTEYNNMFQFSGFINDQVILYLELTDYDSENYTFVEYQVNASNYSEVYSEDMAVTVIYDSIDDLSDIEITAVFSAKGGSFNCTPVVVPNDSDIQFTENSLLHIEDEGQTSTWKLTADCASGRELRYIQYGEDETTRVYSSDGYTITWEVKEDGALYTAYSGAAVPHLGDISVEALPVGAFYGYPVTLRVPWSKGSTLPQGSRVLNAETYYMDGETKVPFGSGSQTQNLDIPGGYTDSSTGFTIGIEAFPVGLTEFSIDAWFGEDGERSTETVDVSTLGLKEPGSMALTYLDLPGGGLGQFSALDSGPVVYDTAVFTDADTGEATAYFATNSGLVKMGSDGKYSTVEGVNGTVVAVGGKTEDALCAVTAGFAGYDGISSTQYLLWIFDTEADNWTALSDKQHLTPSSISALDGAVRYDSTVCVISADDVWTADAHWNGTGWTDNAVAFNSFWKDGAGAYAGSENGVYVYAGSGSWTQLSGTSGKTYVVTGQRGGEAVTLLTAGTYNPGYRMYNGTPTAGVQKLTVSGSSAAATAIDTSAFIGTNGNQLIGVGLGLDGAVYGFTLGRGTGGNDFAIGYQGSFVYKLSSSGWVMQDVDGFNDETDLGFIAQGDFSRKSRPTGVRYTLSPAEGMTFFLGLNGAVYGDFGTSTIRFETNGGSAVQAITAPILSPVTPPSSPTREGYTFVGWYTLDSFMHNGTAYSFSTMPAKDLKLYAKWIEKSSSGSQSDPFATEREKAQESLDTALNRLTQSDYDASTWASIQSAYNTGTANIADADTYDGIYSALNAAVDEINALAQNVSGTMTVAVTVEKFTVDGKYIIEPTLMTVDKNELASVVVTDLLKAHYPSYPGKPYTMTGTETQSFYLSGVWDGTTMLSEFDHGTYSGWMYCINGSFPGVGASSSALKNGDVMRWQYSCEHLGGDIGNDNSAFGGGSGVTVANKDALIWRVAEINQAGEQEKYGDAYDEAMTVLKTITAPQSDVDAALAALNGSDSGGSTGGGSGGEADKDKDEKPTVFVDVAEDAYYADAVAWAVENGITDGVTETEFKPESTCSRGQIVTFLWRAAGSPKPTGTNNPFADVKETDYFYEAVLWAVANGVTDGVDATHFAPARPCTREQAVTFMWRAAGSEQVSGGEPFADVDAGDYSAAAVAWAVANEITDGVSETRFAPENECTRGQIVTFLYREYGEE